MAINDKGLCWLCEKNESIGAYIGKHFSSNDNYCKDCRKEANDSEDEERENRARCLEQTINQTK